MNPDILKEKIPHGDALFPLMVHIIDTDTHLRERLVCHWHEEVELLVVTAGSAAFRIDARSYPVQAGDALFVNSNCLHAATTAENKPFRFFAVVFQPVVLGSCVEDGISQKYVAPVLDGRTCFPEHIRPDTVWGQQVCSLLEQIRDAYVQQEKAFDLLIKAKLQELWYLLYLHAETVQEPSAAQCDYRVARMKAILSYLQRHYRQKITLPELATAFQMSEGQFCRFFKSMMKMSAVEYLNACRIRESGLLLQETDKEIGEIAGLSGFNNISYFNKVFRRYMHCSPSAFRREHAEKEENVKQA